MLRKYIKAEQLEVVEKITDKYIDALKHLKESEGHVEFKAARHNYAFVGGSHNDPRERRRCVLGYVVALANECGGRLVSGMEDARPHNVCGIDSV